MDRRDEAQRHFSSFDQGTLLSVRLAVQRAISASFVGVPGKVTEGKRGPHKGGEAADHSLCRSPGDASVNARAMSRRKQGNPQHLSQREIITRKSSACI